MSSYEEAITRLNKLLLAMLLLGFVAFAAVLGLQMRSSYQQASRTVDQTRAGCQRGLFERVEGIDGDQRQAEFFAAAAIARRAGETKLDRDTATQYERQSKEAEDAAERRKTRMLGADLEVMRMRAGAAPHPRAVAEARAACERQNPSPSWLDL